MSLKEKLTVSASPHVRSPETTTGIMLDVIISLIPALAASVWLFGPRTLLVTATTVLSCMLSEFFSRKIMKRQGTLGDLSAIVTGYKRRAAHIHYNAANVRRKLPGRHAAAGCRLHHHFLRALGIERF